MKQFKKLIIVCLLLSVVVPLFSVRAQVDSPREPIWLTADANSKPGASPQTLVRSVNEQTLDVTITFSGVWAQVQSENGQDFTRLWLDDYSTYREPGQPALPGKTFNILIPAGVKVDVLQLDATSHSINLSKKALAAKIIPAQVQATKSEPPPAWTAPDPERYASRSAYPPSWVEVKDTFQMRDDTILPIWINPLRYQPANGEIELLEKIQLRLTWLKTSADAGKWAVKHDSPSFDRLVSQIVINPPPPTNMDLQTKSGEGYLIITPDEFVEAIQDFVVFKQNQGYIVTITKLSEIGNTTASIQEFIRVAYNTWTPRPTYLLLVGDTNKDALTALLPATTGTVTLRQTDLYYATMDGVDDYVPDIYVGRLPARSEADVTNMVKKIMDYHNRGYQDWHAEAAFISTCDSKLNTEKSVPNNQIAEGSHNFVIDQHTKPLGFSGSFPGDRLVLGGDQLYCVSNGASKSDIIPRINNGRGIITYSGHGAPYGWFDGVISIHKDDITALEDNNISSFIASFSCETNDFGSTLNPIGFGETWMLQSNKGAVVFIGSAAPSYWGADDILERNLFNSIFEDHLNSTPLRIALSSGLSKVQETYPGTRLGEAQYYWETYNLLGDPSQQLWLVTEYQYEASTTALAKDGLINSIVRYPIDITNLGTTDTYTATYSGNNWPVEIEDLANLPYQSSGTLWVNVFIPRGTEVGSSDEVRVIISSASDPSLTTTFTFTTTALFTYFLILPGIFK